MTNLATPAAATQNLAATRMVMDGDGSVDEACEYCGKRDHPVFDVSQYVCEKCLDGIFGDSEGEEGRR